MAIFELDNIEAISFIFNFFLVFMHLVYIFIYLLIVF